MSPSREERLSTAAFLAMYGDRAVDLDGVLALRAPEVADSPMLNRVVGLGVVRPATQAKLDEVHAAMAGCR